MMAKRDPGRVGTGRETWHGTVGGYTNHSCRCRRCKEANRARMAEYRARRHRTRKGNLRKCVEPGCTNRQWEAAGNGLCRPHHETRKESNAA